MKKTFLVGLLATLAAAGTALAQDAPKAPRIGVIAMARVSAESLLGKSYAAQLEKLQNDINAEATKKQTELGKMDAAYMTVVPLWSRYMYEAARGLSPADCQCRASRSAVDSIIESIVRSTRAGGTSNSFFASAALRSASFSSPSARCFSRPSRSERTRARSWSTVSTPSTPSPFTSASSSGGSWRARSPFSVTFILATLPRSASLRWSSPNVSSSSSTSPIFFPARTPRLPSAVAPGATFTVTLSPFEPSNGSPSMVPS